MFIHVLASKTLPLGRMHLLGVLVLSSAIGATAYAAGRGEHGHADAVPEHNAMMNKGHMEAEGAHAHEQWVAPPADYAAYRNQNWDDQAAIQRGHKTFDAQCAACHGVDGRGIGPAAAALDHKPADLTQHFHRGPGMGDAYLFWRVSEGGTAEPFRSQGSAMPPYKAMLDEQDRWDVLTYVHNLFHQSFEGQHDEDNGKVSSDRH
ncbi:MAG: cytochrome c [Pseudomonadota bacterium]|nr:MAG: cytochrome c [Pseudomonadota bacterium]